MQTLLLDRILIYNLDIFTGHLRMSLSTEKLLGQRGKLFYCLLLSFAHFFFYCSDHKAPKTPHKSTDQTGDEL